MNDEPLFDDVIRFANLRARERIAELLADLLMATDTVLETLDDADAREFAWLEPHLRGVFKRVAALLQRVAH